LQTERKALDYGENILCRTLLVDSEDLDSLRTVGHKCHWQTGNREFHTKLKPAKTNVSVVVNYDTTKCSNSLIHFDTLDKL